MSYHKVSILIPTRKRPSYLQRMLDSYHSSLTSTEDSELVFRCDNDDLESIQQLARYDWPIIVGPRREGYKSLPGFYNEMASLATGDLLICGNDDMQFHTGDWPKLIIEEANKYPDGIFNIGVSTGLNEDFFPFSIVSRQFVQKLGKINDERLLFSDVFLLDVMKHFNRAIKLRTVVFFHDWAGHTDDQTRREANQHEFGQVFANTNGDWTEEYRARHNLVVREAISKLDPAGDFRPSQVLEAFDSYFPPAARNGQRWPPSAAPRVWGQPPSPASIHYGRDETSALIRVITQSGIALDQILVSTFSNGLPSLLWTHLFDRVTTICEEPGETAFIEDGNHTTAVGLVGNTRFLYSLMERMGSFSALVLDNMQYSALISPYYLLRRSILRPGIIIFVTPLAGGQEPQAMHLFLEHLRTGYLDGITHDLREIRGEQAPGFTYELIV